MKYDGPFEVSQKVSSVAYRIKLPSSYKIHPVINIAHLENYKGDPNQERPRKHLLRKDFLEEPEHEVEAILDEKWVKRHHRKLKQYLVKFLGYGPEWNEWLSKQALANAPDILKDWELTKKTS